MKKKLLLVALAVVFTFAFVGCGSSDNSISNNSNADNNGSEKHEQNQVESTGDDVSIDKVKYKIIDYYGDGTYDIVLSVHFTNESPVDSESIYFDTKFLDKNGDILEIDAYPSLDNCDSGQSGWADGIIFENSTIDKLNQIDSVQICNYDLVQKTDDYDLEGDYGDKHIYKSKDMEQEKIKE